MKPAYGFSYGLRGTIIIIGLSQIRHSTQITIARAGWLHRFPACLAVSFLVAARNHDVGRSGNVPSKTPSP